VLSVALMYAKETPFDLTVDQSTLGWKCETSMPDGVVRKKTFTLQNGDEPCASARFSSCWPAGTAAAMAAKKGRVKRVHFMIAFAEG
jgi:invasion protein IalB